jgi:hypothetical protein
MLQVFRAFAFVPAVLAARLRRIERRTIARLKDAGANLAERGILLEEGGPLTQFVYRRLAAAGVLIPAGNDRYYLDEAAYDAFRGRRRRRALIVLGVLLVVLLMLFMRGVL